MGFALWKNHFYQFGRRPEEPDYPSVICEKCGSGVSYRGSPAG